MMAKRMSVITDIRDDGVTERRADVVVQVSVTYRRSYRLFGNRGTVRLGVPELGWVYDADAGDGVGEGDGVWGVSLADGEGGQHEERKGVGVVEEWQLKSREGDCITSRRK
jgi:hypothetical protein